MFVGVLLVFIGLFIKKTKKIELINQLDKRKKYNRDMLSAFAGNNLVYMGMLEILLSVFSLIYFLRTENHNIIIGIIIAYLVILIFFSFKVTLRLKKYEISKEDGSN